LIKARRVKWAENVGHTGEMKNTYKILVGKSEGIVRSRCRWECNVGTNLKEIGSEDAEWNHLAQDRQQCPGSCDNEPSDSIKGKEILDQLKVLTFKEGLWCMELFNSLVVLLNQDTKHDQLKTKAFSLPFSVAKRSP